MKFRIEIEIEVDEIEAKDYMAENDIETIAGAVENEITMQLLNDEQITINAAYVNEIKEIEDWK